jgi:hypothetical protein
VHRGCHCPPFSAAKRRRSFLFNGLQGASCEIFAPARFVEQRSIWISSARRGLARRNERPWGQFLIWISLDSLVQNQPFQWVVKLERAKISSARPRFGQAALSAPGGPVGFRNLGDGRLVPSDQDTSISVFLQQIGVNRVSPKMSRAAPRMEAFTFAFCAVNSNVATPITRSSR